MPETLTPRQVEVAAGVAAGLTNGEIAGRLGITAGTVKSHVHNILTKLHISRRTQIATWYGINLQRERDERRGVSAE